MRATFGKVSADRAVKIYQSVLGGDGNGQVDKLAVAGHLQCQDDSELTARRAFDGARSDPA